MSRQSVRPSRARSIPHREALGLHTSQKALRLRDARRLNIIQTFMALRYWRDLSFFLARTRAFFWAGLSSLRREDSSLISRWMRRIKEKGELRGAVDRVERYRQKENYGLSSIEPDDSCGEVDRGEKISSGFVVARGDGPKLLELAKEILDQAAGFIEVFVVMARLFAVGSTPDWRRPIWAWEFQDENNGCKPH